MLPWHTNTPFLYLWCGGRRLYMNGRHMARRSLTFPLLCCQSLSWRTYWQIIRNEFWMELNNDTLSWEEQMPTRGRVWKDVVWLWFLTSWLKADLRSESAWGWEVHYSTRDRPWVNMCENHWGTWNYWSFMNESYRREHRRGSVMRTGGRQI